MRDRNSRNKAFPTERLVCSQYPISSLLPAVLLSSSRPHILHWLILLLLLVGGNQLRGQGPALELGVRGETGGGLGAQRLPGTPNCPDCGTTGTTTERRINFSVGLFLPNSLSNAFGFRLRAGGTFVTGTSVSDPYAIGLVVVDSSGVPVQSQIEYAIDYSPTQFQFEFLGEYAPVSWARMFAGPWGALRLNEPYIQTERIVQPSNARFIVGGRERTVASGSEVSPARGTFGGVVGGGVRWKVAPRITLLPDLFARLTFDVRGDVIGIATATVGGGVGLQIDLLPPPDPAPRADTSATPSDTLPTVDSAVDSAQVAAATTLPTATIDLFALDSAGNQTQVAQLGSRLIRHTRATMIPATIHCNQLDQMLAAATSATPEWSLDSLIRADHHATQQQMFLVFAARLRQLSAARLVMEGEGSSDCRNELRAVLVGRLQVEPDNLVMGSRTRKMQGNPEVSFSATGEGGQGVEGLLAPIASQWFVDDIQEPAFSVLPTMSASAGVRRWSISVAQEERVITSRSSGDASTVPPAAMLLRQPDGSAPPPLVATFTVEDSAGATVTAVDSLPVVPPIPLTANRQPARWDWEEVDLLLQTTNSPAAAPTWKQVLHGYLPELQPGAEVNVVGRRSGGKQVMKELEAMLPEANQGEAQIEFVEQKDQEGVRVVVRQRGK